MSFSKTSHIDEDQISIDQLLEHLVLCPETPKTKPLNSPILTLVATDFCLESQKDDLSDSIIESPQIKEIKKCKQSKERKNSIRQKSSTLPNNKPQTWKIIDELNL